MGIPCYCIPLYQRQTHFPVNCAGLRSKWLSKHYLDHVAPTLLPTFVSSGTTVSLPALTSMNSSKDSSLVSQVQPDWIIFVFKNSGGTKFERAVMVAKSKHLVHQKCGETTNCTLTSIQGNLQDCKFLAASCLIMSRSPELESKCIKVLHSHAFCCSSAPQNQSHAKTSCSAYSCHTQKNELKAKKSSKNSSFPPLPARDKLSSEDIYNTSRIYVDNKVKQIWKNLTSDTEECNALRMDERDAPGSSSVSHTSKEG